MSVQYFYKINSLLLDYPDRELYASLDELKTVINGLNDCSQQEIKVLLTHVDWMQSLNLIELQGLYVQTFDLTAEHSLHLTHHLFGDDRGRGPALVDLAEFYKNTGWEAVESELPDYLPMILEYVSTQDEMAARVFLSDAAKVITVIAENLAKAKSPYAALVELINNRATIAPQVVNH